MEVKTEKEKGTEFIVQVVLRLQEGPCTAAPELMGRRALAVAGDPAACDGVCGMLRELGMRAEKALSGKHALLCAQQASRSSSCAPTIGRRAGRRPGPAARQPAVPSPCSCRISRKR